MKHNRRARAVRALPGTTARPVCPRTGRSTSGVAPMGVHVCAFGLHMHVRMVFRSYYETNTSARTVDTLF